MSLDLEEQVKKLVVRGQPTKEGKQFVGDFNKELDQDQVEYYQSLNPVNLKEGLPSIDECVILSPEGFKEMFIWSGFKSNKTLGGKDIIIRVDRRCDYFDDFMYVFDYYLFLNKFYAIPVRETHIMDVE